MLYVRFLFRKKRRKYVVAHPSFLPAALPLLCVHRGNAVSCFCDVVVVPSVKWAHGTAGLGPGGCLLCGFMGFLKVSRFLWAVGSCTAPGRIKP